MTPRLILVAVLLVLVAGIARAGWSSRISPDGNAAGHRHQGEWKEAEHRLSLSTA